MKRPDSIHQHHELSTFSYNELSSNVKASEVTMVRTVGQHNRKPLPRENSGCKMAVHGSDIDLVCQILISEVII